MAMIRAWLLLSFALLAPACGPRPTHREPAIDQPHAELDVEIITVSPEGLHVSRSVRLGDDLVAMERMDRERVWQTTTRVRPGLGRWVVTSRLERDEQRWVEERYTEYVSAGCAGCTRPVTRYRSRLQTERAPVDICERELRLDARPGTVYLLELHHERRKACKLTCYVQVPLAGREVELYPCE